ncbi:hypothetical protein [Zavarzinella formosa]|uniref:hypothetical protein n=1 Tax=Zavarzinella formosa TaxID=360055 RepID=UPI0003010C6A|nr:hypothetical protein [Zavarzinella formosa]
MSQIETPAIRRRSLRVTLAWAIIGAAAGVALMYAPPVFDGHSHASWNPKLGVVGYSGRAFSDGYVQVCGVDVYRHHRYDNFEETRPVVEWWRHLVTASLAGLGALAGAMVARLTWLGRRSSGRADWRLGLVVAFVVFGVLATAGIPGKQGRSLSIEGWRLFQEFNNSYMPTSMLTDWTVDLGLEALMLAVVSLAFGWAVAAIGVRLPAGRRPDQAADFADGLAPVSGKVC